jgi:hypothetical protein
MAPKISERDAAFWDGCRRGELHVMACQECRERWFPSQERCPACRSRSTSWVPVDRTGVLYTFTVVHGPGVEGRPGAWEAAYPYAVGLVEIDGGGGARIAGTLNGIPVSDLRVGLRVRAVLGVGEAVLPDFEVDDDPEVRAG